MLFMIIEHFAGKEEAVRERFQTRGRLMPEGVTYHASWIDPKTSRCYQVMEAPSASLIDQWIANWSDLVRFEVIPVQTSSEFWASRSKT